MNSEDVKQVLNDIDEVLQDYETEAERLSDAYSYRKSQLYVVRDGPGLNQHLRKPVEEAIRAIEDTRQVQLAITAMLHSLLRFSRATIDSYSYHPISSDAAPGTQAVAFLRMYTLVGYAHTVQVLVTISTSLRQIYQKGTVSDQLPKLKEVLKVAGEVAADEGAKYSGMDSAENIVKLGQVILSTRDALNVSTDSLEKVSEWLDRVDAADRALQSWLADVAFVTVTMESEMKRVLSSRDG